MNDDDFLRSFADRAVPDVPVHTERVIPRAHRRRRIIRTAQSIGVIAVLGVVAGGLGWAWQDAPNPIATPSPTSSPSPTPTPVPTPTHTPEPSAVESTPPARVSSGPASVTADEPYWYIRTETEGHPPPYYEEWTALDQPGMSWVGGTVESLYGLRSVREEVAELTDPLGNVAITDLPHDAQGLEDLILQGTPSGDDASGTDVMMRSVDILRLGGAAPADLRQAALDLLLASPYIVTEPGSDGVGRPGLVLTQIDVELPGSYVVDPDRLLVLQFTSSLDDTAHRFFGEAVVAPPIAPPAFGPAYAD